MLVDSKYDSGIYRFNAGWKVVCKLRFNDVMNGCKDILKGVSVKYYFIIGIDCTYLLIFIK